MVAVAAGAEVSVGSGAVVAVGAEVAAGAQEASIKPATSARLRNTNKRGLLGITRFLLLQQIKG
jgi:hypothetical protein